MILQLITQKCVPVLSFTLEVCSLSTKTLQALDFTTNRILMKLFKTFNIEAIEKCRYFSRRTAISAASVMFSDIFSAVVIRTIYMLLVTG